MQKVQDKTIATLKQAFGNYPSGTIVLVEQEKGQPELYAAWASFYKNENSWVGFVPSTHLQ